MNDKIKKEKEDKIIETASENAKVEDTIVEVVEEKNIPSIEFPALRLADPINFYPTSYSSWRKKIKLNI